MCWCACMCVRGYANDSNNFEWPGHYIMIRGTGRPVGGFLFLFFLTTLSSASSPSPEDRLCDE